MRSVPADVGGCEYALGVVPRAEGDARLAFDTKKEEGEDSHFAGGDELDGRRPFRHYARAVHVRDESLFVISAFMGGLLRVVCAFFVLSCFLCGGWRVEYVLPEAVAGWADRLPSWKKSTADTCSRRAYVEGWVAGCVAADLSLFTPADIYVLLIVGRWLSRDR